jgi:hypothetical protein
LLLDLPASLSVWPATPEKRAQLLLARSHEFFDLCRCWQDRRDSRTAEQRDERPQQENSGSRRWRRESTDLPMKIKTHVVFASTVWGGCIRFVRLRLRRKPTSASWP